MLLSRTLVSVQDSESLDHTSVSSRRRLGFNSSVDMDWPRRRRRLALHASSGGSIDEQDLGICIDRAHSEGRLDSTVIALSVNEGDFSTVAHVAQGQFGQVDLVRCELDGRVYCMKTMVKSTVKRMRQHVNPIAERKLHTLSLLESSPNTPHLLCAFQSSLSLHLVLDYIPSGTLWDLLVSSPTNTLSETDVRFWSTGIVSAIEWMHERGWAHRDVKPHNFLVWAPEGRRTARALLTDFGTAAMVSDQSGSRLDRKDCLWPVGTPDYIAPEVLEAHEDALVRAEEEDEEEREDVDERRREEEGAGKGYGLEVDWWSLAVVIYELVIGEAPFFAETIGDTYWRIVNFETSLQFEEDSPASEDLKDLLRSLLSDHSIRLGRAGAQDVKQHVWFRSCSWETTRPTPAPANLRLPPPPSLSPPLPSYGHASNSLAEAFGFSDHFISSPGLSILHSMTTPGRHARMDSNEDHEWDGFSWGPTPTSFTDVRLNALPSSFALPTLDTFPSQSAVPSHQTPLRHHPQFQTPMRGASSSRALGSQGPPPSTARRRPISDARALQQLTDCVGMSARKRVLESGRKPKYLVLRRFGPGREASEDDRDDSGDEHDEQETEQVFLGGPSMGSLSVRSGLGVGATPTPGAGRSWRSSTASVVADSARGNSRSRPAYRDRIKSSLSPPPTAQTPARRHATPPTDDDEDEDDLSFADKTARPIETSRRSHMSFPGVDRAMDDLETRSGQLQGDLSGIERRLNALTDQFGWLKKE